VIALGVGYGVAIEAGDVEAVAVVADLGDQATVFEAQRQLDVQLAAASSTQSTTSLISGSSVQYWRR